MIPVIAQKVFGHYVAAMASAVIRLLALLALVIMPLGMSGAPALAAPSDNHAMTMAGHCGGQQEQEKAPASKKMDCAAACTAIPATANTEVPVPFKLSGLRTIALVASFTSIVPEIATPPPRHG